MEGTKDQGTNKFLRRSAQREEKRLWESSRAGCRSGKAEGRGQAFILVVVSIKRPSKCPADGWLAGGISNAANNSAITPGAQQRQHDVALREPEPSPRASNSLVLPGGRLVVVGGSPS